MIGTPGEIIHGEDIKIIKDFIMQLKEKIEDDCGILVGENFDGTHFVDWEEINKIINSLAGEKLI